MSVDVKVTPGKLPIFWDREVVYFANLQSLFYDNLEQTKILVKDIQGVPTYGGRLVSILNLLFFNKKNLIFLESSPNKALLEYMEDKLELSLPEIEILPRKHYVTLKEKTLTNNSEDHEPVLERIRQHSAGWLDGYVTDSTLVAIAEGSKKSTISSFEGSKNGNNKFLLHHYLLEKGLPVFETLVASSPEEVNSALKKFNDRGYKKAVIKSQIGASGCGLIRLDAVPCPREQIPEYLFFEGPCLVQGWLGEEVPGVRNIGSPSVQMFLAEKEVTLFDITDQLLRDESIHEGNISPPPYFKERQEIRDEILSQATEAGRWLHSQGYRGTASTDFLVVEKKERCEVIICEINARITGATYPTILARHFLPQGAWLMRNLMFESPLQGSQLLSEVDRRGLLFKKGMERGVLPCNFNLNEAGMVHKGQFVFIAPNTEECENLLAQMQAVFPRSCKYCRD